MFITKIKVAGSVAEVPDGYVTTYNAWYVTDLDDVVTSTSTTTTTIPDGDGGGDDEIIYVESPYSSGSWKRIDGDRIFDGPSGASCSDKSDHIETLWHPVVARVIRLNPISWYCILCVSMLLSVVFLHAAVGKYCAVLMIIQSDTYLIS